MVNCMCESVFKKSKTVFTMRAHNYLDNTSESNFTFIVPIAVVVQRGSPKYVKRAFADPPTLHKRLMGERRYDDTRDGDTSRSHLNFRERLWGGETE